MRLLICVFGFIGLSCASTQQNKDAANYLRERFSKNKIAFKSLDGINETFSFNTTGDIIPPSRYSTLFGDSFGQPGGWEIKPSGHMLITNSLLETYGHLKQTTSIPLKSYDAGKYCHVPLESAFAIEFTTQAPYKGALTPPTTTIFFTDDVKKISAECSRQIAKIDGSAIKEIEKKYGKRFARTIYEKRFEIGMTKDMVVESIGEPDHVNRTVTSRSLSEQWVYGTRGPYLYFEGDKLRSFQD